MGTGGSSEGLRGRAQEHATGGRAGGTSGAAAVADDTDPILAVGEGPRQQRLVLRGGI